MESSPLARNHPDFEWRRCSEAVMERYSNENSARSYFVAVRDMMGAFDSVQVVAEDCARGIAATASNSVAAAEVDCTAARIVGGKLVAGDAEVEEMKSENSND